MKRSEIILIKQGDPNIYKRLVKEWFPKLCILINSYIFNIEIARDLAQEILISLWENRNKLKDDTAFDKYFYVLAKNKAFNYLKQKRYDIIDIEDYETELIKINLMEQLLEKDTLESIIMKENIQKFQTLIQSLPSNSKEIFILSRKYNLKNKDIAARLGVSVKTVEYHITKTLAFFRKNMEVFSCFIIFII
ncbi:RNA polymerase sigma-70 factor [Bacteroides sp.]